ncbi:MAG: hypothetical protein KGJ78_03835 [Alphaproteobacteria bacterium]|nr:hypothetical protein [Alphaproteobacteria bacterium]
MGQIDRLAWCVIHRGSTGLVGKSPPSDRFRVLSEDGSPTSNSTRDGKMRHETQPKRKPTMKPLLTNLAFATCALLPFAACVLLLAAGQPQAEQNGAPQTNAYRADLGLLHQAEAQTVLIRLDSAIDRQDRSAVDPLLGDPRKVGGE